jgi:hypothetical protein
MPHVMQGLVDLGVCYYIVIGIRGSCFEQGHPNTG